MTAHEQAATDGIADGVAVLMGANEGQAGAAGTDPPGYLPCQTGTSLPTVQFGSRRGTRYPPLDVQPKLAARVRLLAAGAVNKNDPNDARSVAVRGAALHRRACRSGPMTTRQC